MNDDETWTRITPLSTDEEGQISDEKVHTDSEKDTHDKINQDDFSSDSILHCFVCEKKNKKGKAIKSSLVMLVSDEKEILLEDILKEVPRGIRRQLQRLFNDFREVLAINIEELGGSKLLPHTITLEKDTLPIKQKAYRLSKVQAEVLKVEISKLLKHKLIEPSTSPWSSPVILVLKKNGKWRLWVDYRKLNNVTLKDAYAIL